ncbi:hypothetical protein [Stenotrophomonas maltophilia]|uniref:hypothetical protein n=1 Tax=Stenotrophomonas maltophilia TaxID=40324 RepID=UPI0013DD7F02|nr:hypothetical protein [Stenotrophomonas maltophilia]
MTRRYPISYRPALAGVDLDRPAFLTLVGVDLGRHAFAKGNRAWLDATKGVINFSPSILTAFAAKA